MTAEQRQLLRELVDRHKRAEIARAHGNLQALTGIRRLSECEYCGGLIEATRRFCDQQCINAARIPRKKRR